MGTERSLLGFGKESDINNKVIGGGEVREPVPLGAAPWDESEGSQELCQKIVRVLHELIRRTWFLANYRREGSGRRNEIFYFTQLTRCAK